MEKKRPGRRDEIVEGQGRKRGYSILQNTCPPAAKSNVHILLTSEKGQMSTSTQHQLDFNCIMSGMLGRCKVDVRKCRRRNQCISNGSEVRSQFDFVEGGLLQ